jgi:hypothetical protein
MTQPGARLPLPMFGTYYGDPVKIVRLPDGGVMTWRLDHDTGGWEPANDILDDILFSRGGEVRGNLPRDKFIQEVEQERAYYLEDREGPIFALYDTIRAIDAAAERERRDYTPTEHALVLGLRRRTYAMFEAELARNGDPGADVEAARAAGLLESDGDGANGDAANGGGTNGGGDE